MSSTLSARSASADLLLSDPSLFRTSCYVGGQWADALDGKTFPVTNPADGSVIAEVPDMGSAEAQSAVLVCDQALPGWRRLVAADRTEILKKWHGLILSNEEDLARIISLEQGKPLEDARWEVRYAASFVEWYAEEAKRVYGETIPQHHADKRLLVWKQPIGVVAAITPWNFPCAMVTRKAAPALAAGCTMVLKPAEQTPFSALALCELAHRAGVPPGVFNVITGDAPPIGKVFTSHPTVRKVTFTGSTEVGKILMAQSASSVKKVSLELGGNAPFIVFDDADLDEALAGVMASKYRLSGQTCVCANRIYLHDAIYDTFAQKLVDAVAKLHIGAGLDPETTLGPLIDEDAIVKVEELVADAVSNGARVLIGGKRISHSGSFYQPTVLSNVTASMRIANAEIFGPVAPLFRFSSEEDLIRQANATNYGLAAYFFSRDLARLWRIGEALEFGMVGVNTGILSTESAPFGGIKESGIGREGSRHGLDEFLEMKYLCVGGVS